MHTHTLVPRCQEDPVLRTALLPFGNAHKAAFAAAHCRTPRINYAGGKYIAWPSLSPFFMFITEHAFKANASCWWKSLVGFSGSGFIAHMEPFGCVFSVSCKHSCMSQHRHVVQFGGRRHTPTSRQVAHVVEGHWASAAQIGESEWGAAPARRHSHTSTPPHNLPRNPPNGPPGRTLLLAVPGRAASGDGVLGSRTHVCSGDVFGLAVVPTQQLRRHKIQRLLEASLPFLGPCARHTVWVARFEHVGTLLPLLALAAPAIGRRRAPLTLARGVEMGRRRRGPPGILPLFTKAPCGRSLGTHRCPPNTPHQQPAGQKEPGPGTACPPRRCPARRGGCTTRRRLIPTPPRTLTTPTGSAAQSPRTFGRVEFFLGAKPVLASAPVVDADKPPREAEAARLPHCAHRVFGQVRAQVALLGELGCVVCSALCLRAQGRPAPLGHGGSSHAHAHRRQHTPRP